MSAPVVLVDARVPFDPEASVWLPVLDRNVPGHRVVEGVPELLAGWRRLEGLVVLSCGWRRTDGFVVPAWRARQLGVFWCVGCWRHSTKDPMSVLRKVA